MIKTGRIAYEQGQQIGQGQGQNSLGVFVCSDPQLAGTFAVKVIAKASLKDPARVWSEAHAMHASDHPNVVPIQYACQDDDNIMLAMPYYRHGSLADRIVKGPIRLFEVIHVGQGILSGLAQIHAAGYCHFDVKPSNVLFSDYNVPLVADFGQSRQTQRLGIAPSPVEMYNLAMPPEMLASPQGDQTADVFQAGLTMYRAVNGDPFFDEQVNRFAADIRAALATGDFPPKDRYMPHVPLSLKRVLNKAMHVDHAQRYSTARQFAAALGQVVPTNNWGLVCHPNQQMEWRSQRLGQPDLVVRLTGAGSNWTVTIHHERAGKCRKAKSALWRDGLRGKMIGQYLRQVFETLG